MAILDRIGVGDARPEKRLRDLIDAAERRNPTHKLDSFYEYLKQMLRSPSSTAIAPFEVFVNVVDLIFANTRDFNASNYTEVFRKAEQIYKVIFDYEEQTANFEELLKMYYEFFREDGIIAGNLFDARLYNCFMDKHIFEEFCKDLLFSSYGAKHYFPSLVEYAVQARPYFIDEASFKSNLMNVLLHMSKTADTKRVVEEEMNKVLRLAGVYDIDEIAVSKADEQLLQAKSMLRDTIEAIEAAEQKIEALKHVTKVQANTIEEIGEREVTRLQSMATNARQSLDKAFDDFMETQKKVVLLEKDALVAQVVSEAEARVADLQRTAMSIVSSASIELAKINTQSGEAISRVRNYIEDDEQLKQILANSRENEDLIKKVRKLEILNDSNIEVIERNISAASAQAGVSAAPASDSVAPVSENAANAAAAVQAVAYATPQPTISTAPVAPAPAITFDEVMKPVNPLLDPTVPFRDRYDIIQRKKQKMIEEGEHFHKMFDDVLIALMENVNPYLVGPSGCGKTYMVNQLARLLDMEAIDIGYINEEYDILGFQTANGGYSTPNFYRCYKYGKIAFCDELDNGNSRATVKLNSFLSNTSDAAYNFPNGEHVPRHQSFRIIAAGNTAGNGADANYNTREKIEESVQQRLTPIYVGYDNEVEKKIMGQYEDWFEFIVLFRIATDEWEEKNFMSAPGILTTRDSAKIRQYLDNQSFSMSQILDYEFIQTKDNEYLSFLQSVMRAHIAEHPAAQGIFAQFDHKVENLRKRG